MKKKHLKNLPLTILLALTILLGVMMNQPLPVYADDSETTTEATETTETTDEDEIVIPAQVMIMDSDEWNNLTWELSGVGDKNIVSYGGQKTGQVINTSIEEDETSVNLYGGYTDEDGDDVSGNTINVNNGDEGWIAYEDPNKYNDSYARVHIFGKNGEPITLNVIGGHSKNGEVSGNTININGGTINGYVIAAETKSNSQSSAAQRLHDNVVNIFNAANLSSAKIYGAAVYSDSDRSRSAIMGSNNTLNVYTKNITVNELTDFNNYNFYLPRNTVDQDLIINVIGNASTNIKGSNILAVVDTNSYLVNGNEVTLIQNYSGITDNTSTSYEGIYNDGSTQKETKTAVYSLEVLKSDESHVVLRVKGERLRPFIEILDDPPTQKTTIVNHGGNLLTGGGLREAANVVGFNTPGIGGSQTYVPFFAAEQSYMKHKTGGEIGSHSTSMLAGFSRKFENEKHRLLVAPFVEYGFGKYKSDSSEGVHGNGKSHYVGGGIVFKNKFNDGRYYEGSVRAGRAKTDYETNNFPFNNQYLYEYFKSSSPYIGFHFGLGREKFYDEKNSVDYYAKFFYTHVSSDSVKLTTGERYHLSPVNSDRLRLGTRYTHQSNQKNQVYVGAAYEYEFHGNAYAVYQGMKTKTSTLRGGSGMLEVGWIYKPEANDKWSLDLSCEGWAGRQKGLRGRFGLNWNF